MCVEVMLAQAVCGKLICTPVTHEKSFCRYHIDKELYRCILFVMVIPLSTEKIHDTIKHVKYVIIYYPVGSKYFLFIFIQKCVTFPTCTLGCARLAHTSWSIIEG